MTTFAITDTSQTVDAVNYLLANMGQGGSASGNTTTGNNLVANPTTGAVTTGGTVVSYLYRYLNVRYATSADGSQGFSTSPTNATYYGVHNSNSTGSDSNPTDYQWTQVTGGFGTTKSLYYATYGGNTVAFSIGTQAPSSSYTQVPSGSNPLIDLQFVTATSTLPLVTPFAYIQSANVPATPSGGTYDFGNLVLTPPSGWTANLPASSNTVVTYASQAKFQAVASGANVAPTGTWSVPVALVQIGANGSSGSNGVSTYNYSVFQSANTAPSTPTGGYYTFSTNTGIPPTGWSNTPTSANGAPIWASTATLTTTTPSANISIGNTWTTPFQYTGAGGAQGTRGFIPMGYVLTPSNPIGATTVQLSSWFGASRNNTTAPIGMGTPPINLDTACFTQQGNTLANIVYTFDGGNNVWTSVQGSVVNGNVFVTGSVNAAAMAANDVYALTMRGGTVTPGINSGTGYWLQANTGNAYMGGNVYIGGNLTVAGLITSSSNTATLNSNVVNTTQLVNNSVSVYFVNENFTVETINNPVSGTWYDTNLIINNVPLSNNSTLVYTSSLFQSLNFTPPTNVIWYYDNLIGIQYRANGSSTWSSFTSQGSTSPNFDQYYGSWVNTLLIPTSAANIFTNQNYDFKVQWQYLGPYTVATAGNTAPNPSNVQIGGQNLTLQVYKK